MSAKGSTLDGTYILKESTASKPHPTCQDNCIYWKVDDFGDDFCFREVDQIEGANIQCEAVSPTDILSTLSTASIEILLNTTLGGPEPVTATSTKAVYTLSEKTTAPTSSGVPRTEGTIEQTTTTSEEMTTSFNEPSTTAKVITIDISQVQTKPTTKNLSTKIKQSTAVNTSQQTTHYVESVHYEHDQLVSQKIAFEAKLAEASANQANAEALTTELTSVQSYVASLISGRRMKRVESTKPAATCTEIVELIDKISEAINASNTSIATIYAKRITSSTVSCSQSEITALEGKQASLQQSKSTSDTLVDNYKALVKATKTKINEQITKLNAINGILNSYGQTTIHHGTHHDHEDDNITSPTPGDTNSQSTPTVTAAMASTAASITGDQKF